MTVDEYRAAGYALAEAIRAHTDATCQLITEAQVDYKREFGAVTVREAAELLDMGDTTIRTMTKDGRLAYVNERIPLWSIHELLHMTPAQRRKKPMRLAR